jgi:hypothetical protein
LTAHTTSDRPWPAQEFASRRFGLDAEALGEQPAGVCKGFDHADPLAGVALLQQALKDRAGHVAAADECDVTVHAVPVVAGCRAADCRRTRAGLR